ncbi:glucosyltransferase domain-containing protein [Lysinibacillus sp. SGAir0095]|uniref:glucosyltransferase domain-containing protein n=1 Tax=Lysinibacillus sp. SGAir0095 TaxID=2070463 RepID=UPI0010CD4760|nr:glucosyltransferase domain-containing protein [Lysinibacillus sp. SGAir0095]QCR31460.1 hypothetical protein C1N55_04455 [Lysinibacillus sp. SGAir0095]
MPENIGSKLRGKIQYEWKLAIISAFIIGLLTHLYIFLHRLPNHDGLLNIYSSQAKVSSGRFFLSNAAGLSSYFDMPWVIGLFSILFLSLAAACIVCLFEVKKKMAIVLISGIVVAFPSVSATFSYMFTADGYMLGTFLAVLAVLLTKKYKFGFIIGAVALCLGVGIYQANLSVAMAFITLWLMHDILLKKTTTKQLGLNVLRSALMLGIGMVSYLVVYKIYTKFLDVSITSYQGLDKVGSVTLDDIPKVFETIDLKLKTFFFNGFVNQADVNLLEWLNVFLLITLIISTITVIVKNKVYNSIVQILIFVLLVLSLPISFYVVYFLSPEAEYHMLMIFSISSIYIYLILLYDAVEVRKSLWIEKINSWATVILLTVTIYNFGLIANIVYFNMELKYERSIQLANRLIDRVEQLEDYEDIKKIHVIGRYRIETPLPSVIIPQKIPQMVGSTGEHLLVETAHIQKIFANFLGYELLFLMPDELEEMNARNEIKEMGIWPVKESVQVIDDVLVIKFEEQ